MTSESRGYSTVLVARVMKSDPRLISMRLAKVCFEHNLPVQEVSKRLGVSRASVYSWFKCEAYPKKSYHDAIEKLMAEFSSK